MAENLAGHWAAHSAAKMVALMADCWAVQMVEYLVVLTAAERVENSVATTAALKAGYLVAH